MEKYYRLKCRQIGNSSQYEITKNNFLFEKGENYLFYTNPCDYSDYYYLLQKKDCFVINFDEVKIGDILCVENDKRRTHFILIGVFKEKTYEQQSAIFLVGKGFSTKTEAIEFYKEHREEIEDKELEITTNFKNNSTFVYVRKNMTTFDYVRNDKSQLISEKVNDFDIQELSEKSEMVKKALKEKRDFNLYTLYQIQEGLLCNSYNQFSLHPNGNCGCIELDDDYMFGIRCNHLMWSECCCEGVEDFWDEDNLDEYDVILIYGNHKGEFTIKILVIK